MNQVTEGLSNLSANVLRYAGDVARRSRTGNLPVVRLPVEGHVDWDVPLSPDLVRVKG